MPGTDIMEIEILADGTIKVETSKVSGPNHMTAEQFLKRVGELAGGEVKRSRRGHSHAHGHTHDHEHDKH